MPGHARVIGCPNPFTTKVVDGWAPAGVTLREAVAGLVRLNSMPAGWARHGHIWVDGRKIPRVNWDDMQLRAGQLVNFRIVPAGGGGGGGGKNPLRMVMSIAVMAAAWYYAPYIAANFTGAFAAAGGGSIFGGSLITTMSAVSAVIGGGMTLAGNVLINAIAPVSNSKSSSTVTGSIGTDDTKATYSLSGSSNSARKFEPCSVVLGKVRRTADHAANPYSESSGSDQWGHYLFFWSLGTVTLSDFKLGETDLSVFLKSAARDIMPEMEATTSSGATITASVNSATAWYLGNNSHSNYWSGGAEVPIDIFFDLGSKRGVQGYTLRPHASYLVNMATGCELAWTEDNVTWNTVDTQTALSWPDATKQKFDIPSVVQARNWRLRITEIAPDVDLVMDEVEILGGLLIETHEGRDNEADFTLYTGNTHEESINAQLLWQDDETQESTIRYTESGCTEFEVELYANQGLWRYPLNTSYAYGVSVTVEALYRIKGSSDDLKRIGSQDDAGWMVKVGEVDARVDRRACRFTLSSGTLLAGQYEIHLRRIARNVGNSNTEDGTIFDTLYWSVLRTKRPGNPVTLPVKWSGSALCVKANEDFTGSLPAFSALCASECLDWDAETETWITRQTSNPASLMRYWLQLPCRIDPPPVPDSRINLEQLQRFHAFCQLKGFEFNGEACLRGKSIRAVLRQICAAGRGSATCADGIYSVVWDDVQDEIRQLYNDRNSWSFKEESTFGKIPHALRVSFDDEENDYQTDETIVYDDGYDATNATLFESTSFDGVTSHAQVQKMGRNYLAQLRLRPRKYSWNTTMQYLVAPRGSLAAVATSVIKVGLVAACIKSVTFQEAEEGEDPAAISVKLDQACAMEAGTDYALQYRRSDGKVTTQPVEFLAYETRELTFTEPVMAIIAPEEGGLCTFGPASAPSLTLLIETIAPADDFTATVTGVDYSPGIFTADSLPIPPWESHITQTVYGQKVAAPVINSIRSDESAILVNADASMTVRAEIAFTVPSGAPVAASSVEAQFRQVGAAQWSQSVTAPTGVGALYITGVEEGIEYEFRMRAVATAGLASAWSAATVHTVVGKTSSPPDVSWITAQVNGALTTIRYSGVSVPDLKDYTMRYAKPDGWAWESAAPLTLKVSGTDIATASIPPGTWRIGIKANDTTRHASVNAAVCDVTVASSNYLLAREVQDGLWLGAKSNLVRDPLTGLLIPISKSAASSMGEEFWDDFVPDAIDAAWYETPEIDTVITSAKRIFAETLEAYAALSDTGAISSSDLHLEMATRDEGGSYGAFARWNIGDATARFIKLRAVWSPSLSPVALQSFIATIDAATRTETDDITVSAGGTSITFNTPFSKKPNVVLTNLDSSARIPVASALSETGMTIESIDLSNVSAGGSTRYAVTGV